MTNKYITIGKTRHEVSQSCTQLDYKTPLGEVSNQGKQTLVPVQQRTESLVSFTS